MQIIEDVNNQKLSDYYNGDDLPMNVWKGKYACPGEITPDDMHRRMANELARVIESRESLQAPRKQWKLLSKFGQNHQTLDSDAIYNLFKDFKQIIPQGSIMAMLGSDKIGSLSNCFVVGQPSDSYGGILEKDQQLAQLMKRRGGCGIDISTLRPAGISVTNAAGTSTGAVSFMHRYSNTTREVAQNGRRGALMITMDVRHPDIFDFINIKRDKTAVTGANISVMLRKDFMEAVKKDEDYILRFPCTENMMFDKTQTDAAEYDKLVDLGQGRYFRKIKASRIYDSIVENAWENAEPGQMFVDRHWEYSPDGVYPQYKGVTTNPCGEIFMQMYDACRLIAMNLISIVNDPFVQGASINYEKLYKLSYIQQRLSDAVVDLELEHIDRILNKIEKDPESKHIKAGEMDLWRNIRDVASSGRRTGCGFTGLGDMIAAVDLAYDSDEAMKLVDKVLHTKLKAELDCSIDMAIQYGPFKGWDPKLEYTDASKSGLDVIGNNDFYNMILEKCPDQFEKMFKYGRRNISWNTCAPTGSLSIIAKAIKFSNISAGMEPQYLVLHYRNKKINLEDLDTITPDFVDQNGDAWQQFPVMSGAFKDWININYDVDPDTLNKKQVDEYFEASPWYGSCAPDIDWKKRVEMQSVIQKYTSHSISSTINLPETVSKEEVAEIYMHAYDHNLKGVTVYREGSRTGVLVSKVNQPVSKFEYHDAPKRPKCLPAEVHTTSVKGTKWNVIVGLYDGKPYEVFAVPHFTGDKAFEICKVKRGHYSLISSDGETVLDEINSRIHTEAEANLTRIISTSLRHGTDITFLVEQLNKSIGDITSFTKAIARTLKKYVNEERMLSRATCADCESTALIFEEGCIKCTDCGSSKCS